MLDLSEAQVEALRAAARRSFRERAVAHVREHFPNHARVAGAAALEATVDHNLARAAEYGLRTQRRALLYLTTAMMLGSDFDRSPAFPWVGGLLNAPEPAGDRAYALAQAALAHQRQIAGPGNRSLNRAFVALARGFPSLADPAPRDQPPTRPSHLLGYLHPERTEAFGAAVMAQLDAQAMARAHVCGLIGGNGALLIGISICPLISPPPRPTRATGRSTSMTTRPAAPPSPPGWRYSSPTARPSRRRASTTWNAGASARATGSAPATCDWWWTRWTTRRWRPRPS